MRLSIIVKTIAINIIPKWPFKTSIKSVRTQKLNSPSPLRVVSFVQLN